jgi:hypothetical protein
MLYYLFILFGFANGMLHRQKDFGEQWAWTLLSRHNHHHKITTANNIINNNNNNRNNADAA